MTSYRYNLMLSDNMRRDLATLSERLMVSKAEVIRRALTLYKHAVEADAVEFLTRPSSGGHQERVRILVK